MFMRFHASTIALVMTATVWSPLLGQDRFGSSVAVGRGDVLVLKPAAGRGPATLYVYRGQRDGSWRAVDKLRPVGGQESGESYSVSLATSGDVVLVGSADPESQWGAHVFRASPTGAWAAAGKIPLVTSSRARDATLDLASLMRILQPPRRVVAIDGNRAAVAVVGGPATTQGVRILERDAGSGSWVIRARLVRSDTVPNDQFGAALALSGDRVLVGAPAPGRPGAAYLFARHPESGTWREEAKVSGDGGGADAQFGAAVAFDGEVALVGAPADTTGAIVTLARDPVTGAWTKRSRLTAPSGAEDDGFGAALAVQGNELWVGAPAARADAGRIHRFVRDEARAAWRPAEPISVAGVEAGFSLGAALAVDRGVAVAGAPGADGGRGRAVVLRAAPGGGWAQVAWLTAGEALSAVTGGEVRCAEGHAAQFDCRNVDLLAFVPIEMLGGDPGERVSDLWGWTDRQTGREYALVGRSGGAVFVEVTDPARPVYLGVLAANRSGARDLKVYQDHLFFTGDGAGDHGMLVFDLTRLRDVQHPPVRFEPDARYDGITSAHNLIVDTQSGFAYPVGASGGGQTCGGGLHMIDIRNPIQPTFAGCYTDTEGLIWPGRTHDGQCVRYDGPDDDYRGRQICFASNETALRIVDVTDKAHPTPVASATYPGLAYVHQGWLTDDQRYFYLDDELDELVGLAPRTRTLVVDVADLDDPLIVAEYLGPDGATDHNLYVKGDRMYQANYQGGLRVVDISDREHPVEVGFFDTTPYEGNPPGFNGAWTAFPFFDSGTVIVSSMNEGLFVLRPRTAAVIP